MIKIFLLQTKGLRSNISINFYLFMNEINGKTTFEQLFQFKCLGEKGTFVGEKTNGSFNHVPFRRRGTTFQSEGD
jgi:hypothetical protein